MYFLNEITSNIRQVLNSSEPQNQIFVDQRIVIISMEKSPFLFSEKRCAICFKVVILT